MKRVLIVIDMQNDFIDEALGTKEAQTIVPNVMKKVMEYREAGDKIIFTRDTHTDNYLKTSEGKKLPVPHCIKDTKGWEISNKLNTTDCDVIDKYSFGWTGWSTYYDFTDDQIEIVGLCTDICVVSNALILKAQFPETDITVDASCCAGVTPESHQAALTTMKMCQINVIGE